MFRIHPRTLLTAALLPTALLMAAGGVRQPGCRYRERHERHTRRAFAGQLLHHAAHPSPVAVRAGHRTRITVSFQAATDLYGTPVALSVSGLPGGVTASFSPPAAAIGGRSVLTLTAAPSRLLKKSANGRYLVDQNDRPFLITGDSPQAMFVNLSAVEADAFLADRAAGPECRRCCTPPAI
jgi:hypothetical protein